MEEIIFPMWEDAARLAKNRKIVLFGAGTYANKTVKKINGEFLFVVDNNQNLWDTHDDSGLIIHNPSCLKKIDDKLLIIICSTSFREISDQLAKMNFSSNEDIIVSPILNDLRVISKMESVKTNLIFSSGFTPDKHPKYGGGLYHLSLDGYEWEYKKIYSGRCHGIIPFEDGFITIDQSEGILHCDRKGNLKRRGHISDGSRGHGITYSSEHKKFFIAASHLDQILVYDLDLNFEKSIALSHKYHRYGVAKHHCNDICSIGDSLYVSMFSLSGNFSESDIYDGGILEIDIVTGERIGPVIRDLWMPHNVMQIAGNLVVCDSLPGYLRKNNAQIVGEFPGFTRGLAHDGSLFYIGQSRNRNYSKYLGVSRNISIDASIVIFDENTKVSRSLQLPPQLSEIHAITLLENH